MDNEYNNMHKDVGEVLMSNNAYVTTSRICFSLVTQSCLYFL